MDARTKALVVALGALTLFGLLVAWFGPSEPPKRASNTAAPVAEATEPRLVVKSPSPLSPSGDHEARPFAPLEARPGARVHDASEHDEREHPHPITERHRSIQRENNLRALLNEAVTARNGERVRELLREYRLSHPEDPNRLQAGYQVLAECLTNPSDTARVEAARYYDAHRGSILRRSIRRVCLEG
jgi:hypothetical protein